MERVARGSVYKKFVSKLDVKQAKMIERAVEKFQLNPSLRSLNLEKMDGTADLWSIRVNIHVRLILQKCEDEEGSYWMLKNGGTHQVYRTLGR